jgi:ribonuclease HII
MPTMDYERELRAAGHAVVAGVDEAGRGPLAGPVSVAAVILPCDYGHEVLDDSKKLTEKRRELLYEELVSDPAVVWHVVLVSARRVDEINILRATHEGMRLAVEGLRVAADAVLIDGRPVRPFPLPQRALVKGDSLSYSIAAASVIAKVTRDRVMLDVERRFPGYGFGVHKGYGTAQHLEALRVLGPCEEHRRSFAPVRAALGGEMRMEDWWGR